jgi:hypothetical protein
MEKPDSNVRVDTREANIANVIIEVPLEEGDADDYVVFSKAWAILAERITFEKWEEAAAEGTIGADGSKFATPGNSAWWNG